MKILVCTDGSPASRAILPHAGRLARATDAEIVFLRVLDERVDAAAEVAPHLQDAVARVQARWEDDLGKTLAAEGLRGSVLVGKREWGKDVADAIHAAADKAGAALLAISSRGAGAVRHTLLGSVALDVISRTNLPLMTMAGAHPARQDGDPYHIVVTSDGSPDSRSIFKGLEQILVPGKTKVTLLEVVTTEAQDTEEQSQARALPYLRSLVGRIPGGVAAEVLVRVIPPGAAVDTAIVAVARGLGADAIASATHGHSARRHLIAGSTALGVVEKAGMPVILVKSKAVD